MSRSAPLRRTLVVAFAVLGTGAAIAACSDAPSAPEAADPVQIQAPSASEDGEHPCNIYLDATCNPNPCFYGPETPGCENVEGAPAGQPAGAPRERTAAPRAHGAVGETALREAPPAPASAA